nr:oligosaccharide flippase family protein [uncultured Ruminococcus sp.]
MNNINQKKVGVLLSYVNLAISTIIPFFYTPIMLAILGQSEYGLYSLSNSVISYLSLLQFGMGSAVIRYIAKYRATDEKEKANQITGLFTIIYIFFAVLVLFVGCIFTLLSPVIFSDGLSEAEISKMKILIIIMSLSTAFSFISVVFSSIINAYEKFIFKKTTDIILTILAPLFNLLVLFLGYESVGIATVSLIFQIVVLPIYMWYVAKRLGIKMKFVKPEKAFLLELFSFSIFMFLSSIADLLFWSTDNVLIGAMIGSTAVAVYNVGGVFTNLMRNLTSAINDVFVPKVTMMVAVDKSNTELSELMIRVGRLQYLMVSLLASGFIVFGQVFIHYWSGDVYADAYWVSLVTFLPSAIPILQNIAFGVIVAQHKHKFRCYIYFGIAILNAISTFFIIPYFGYIGAAICSGVSYIIGHGIILNIYYKSVIKLDIFGFWMNILKMSFIPVIITVIGYWIVNILIPWNIILMLVEGIGFVLVFILLTWFFTMNEYEKDIFKGLLNSVIRLKRRKHE